MELAAGQNVPLGGTALTVTVTGPVDLTALVLGADGQVSGDADMVFFNQPRAAGVTLDGARLDLDLGALRPGAESVALVASPSAEDVTFGDVGPIALTVAHGGEELVFRPGAQGTETALVLCTAYLRAGRWKLRAVGQGYASGLAGVATDFGIEVDDEPEAAPPPPPKADMVKPAPAPPAEPRIDMAKTPVGAIDLQKSGSAVIPLTKADAHKLIVTCTLKWTGRKTGASDLDLYALYVDAAGHPGVVYYKDKGGLGKSPWMKLDKDSRGAGAETLRIIAGRHPYILLCAYSAVENGVGAFSSYNAHVVVDDGQGSVITVPLFGRNKFAYWVAIALVDATDPAGLKISQVERYGKSFSEKRPVLAADGSFQMSKGKVEFK